MERRGKGRTSLVMEFSSTARESRERSFMHVREIKGVETERGREGGRRREKREEEAKIRRHRGRWKVMDTPVACDRNEIPIVRERVEEQRDMEEKF